MFITNVCQPSEKDIAVNMFFSIYVTPGGMLLRIANSLEYFYWIFLKHLTACLSRWLRPSSKRMVLPLQPPLCWRIISQTAHFCAIKDGTLFNYADDNTVMVTASTKHELMCKLTESGNCLSTWCFDNQMEANTSKFQFMISNEATSSVLKFGYTQ